MGRLFAIERLAGKLVDIHNSAEQGRRQNFGDRFWQCAVNV